MNRRTALRSAAALAVVGTAGCLDAFREHFEGSIGQPVPLSLHSEASHPYRIRIKAYDPQTNRETYDEPLVLRPGERASPSHLSALDQQFQVTRLGGDDAEDLVEAGTITTETASVSVTVYDDDLVLEITEREGAAGNESANATDNESTNATGDGSETEPANATTD